MKKNDKHVQSNVRCGNCGARIDVDWLCTYQPGNDTRICLCRFCADKNNKQYCC